MPPFCSLYSHPSSKWPSSWLVQVREQGQQKGEASPILSELLRLEEQAKQQYVGRWSKVPGATEASIWDLPSSAISDPNNLDVMGLLATNKGKPMEGILEQVRDGSTIRVYLLPDFQFVQVFVVGIQVYVVLEGVDKFSNLIGSVYYPEGETVKDLTLELVENVVEVVSGDCIVVADDSTPYGSPLAEHRVNLLSIKCPKIGNPRRDEKPAAYAREARENLYSSYVNIFFSGDCRNGIFNEGSHGRWHCWFPIVNYGLLMLHYQQHLGFNDEFGTEAAQYWSEQTLGSSLQFKAVIEERDTSEGKIKGQGTGTCLVLTFFTEDPEDSINEAMLKDGLARLEKRMKWESNERKLMLNNLEECQEEAKTGWRGM
ncbi:hypothetical protein GOBAR_DD07794 [Gossypium barbadense]|nr:hypothetical protein GOBAR_DD07794 [Gossypium barbadense]